MPDTITAPMVLGLRGPGGVVTPAFQTLHDEAVTAATTATDAAASVAGSAATIAENASDIASALYSVDTDPPEAPSRTLGVLQPTVGVAQVNFRRAVLFPGYTFTDDDKILGFDVEIVDALSGRTIEFYVSGGDGTIKWASGALDASAAGEFSYDLPSAYKPETGDYPGWWISSAQISDGIFGRDNQGNGAIGNIIYNEAATQGRLTVGDVYTASTSGWVAATRYLPSLVVRTSSRKILVATSWANKPNGWVQLDDDGALPEGIGDSLTPLATALTVPAAPVVGAGAWAARKVLILGNSIDAGGQADAEGSDAHYGVWQQVRDYLGWEDHNMAIPGSGITSWSQDLDSLRTDALALAGITDVIIRFGENDGTLPPGTAADAASAGTFAGFLNGIIADVHAQWPSANIIIGSFMSPWPIYTSDAVHGPKQWLRFEAQDAVKKQIALAGGWYYLDYRSGLPGPQYVQNMFKDGLHPNTLMHTEVLKPITLQYLGGL